MPGRLLDLIVIVAQHQTAYRVSEPLVRRQSHLNSTPPLRGRRMKHGRQGAQQVPAVLFSEDLPPCKGAFDDVYHKLLEPYIKELILYRSPAPAWKSTRCIELYSSLKLRFSEVQQPTTTTTERMEERNIKARSPT